MCDLQTELLARCADVPPVARLVHEDGKLLLLAVLEVSDGFSQFPAGWSATSQFAGCVFHQAIGGQSSRSLMDQFAEILFCLNKHCFALLTVWLKDALRSPGFPSSRVTDEQKDTFSQQVLR